MRHYNFYKVCSIESRDARTTSQSATATSSQRLPLFETREHNVKERLTNEGKARLPHLRSVCNPSLKKDTHGQRNLQINSSTGGGATSGRRWFDAHLRSGAHSRREYCSSSDNIMPGLICSRMAAVGSMPHEPSSRSSAFTKLHEAHSLPKLSTSELPRILDIICRTSPKNAHVSSRTSLAEQSGKFGSAVGQV